MLHRRARTKPLLAGFPAVLLRQCTARPAGERDSLRTRNGFHFNAQEFLIEFTGGRQALDAIPPLPPFPCASDPAPQAPELCA